MAFFREKQMLGKVVWHSLFYLFILKPSNANNIKIFKKNLQKIKSVWCKQDAGSHFVVMFKKKT